MTTILNSLPPILPSAPASTAPIATDSDGDNDGSTSPVAASPAARGPASVTDLSVFAQALLNSK